MALLIGWSIFLVTWVWIAIQKIWFILETHLIICQRNLLRLNVIPHEKFTAGLRCKHIPACVSPDVSGESSQSGAQFQGRPSEVWSQWQNQHHSQPAGEQHTHPNPSQTEVFQVTHTHTHTPAVCQSVLAADQCTQICNISDRDVCLTSDPPPCVSAGHVTHGWRSHSGNSQLQYWGLCWPWHVPTLLWVTAPPTPPPSLSLPELDWRLHLSHVVQFFPMLLHRQQTVNVGLHLSFAHIQTHSLPMFSLQGLWTYTYLIAATRNPAVRWKEHQSTCRSSLSVLTMTDGVCESMKPSAVSASMTRGGQSGDYSCASNPHQQSTSSKRHADNPSSDVHSKEMGTFLCPG